MDAYQITFSPEVNAVNLPDASARTADNRVRLLEKVVSACKAHNLGGFTLSGPLQGCYIANDGQVFHEESRTLTVLSDSAPDVEALAKSIASAFTQESTLVVKLGPASFIG